MPKTKSTVLARQHNAHFRWWVGLIIICAVAIAGIIILRFSQASEAPAQADCTPSLATATILNSSSTRLTNASNQKCMTTAFLNRYTGYHSKVGNLAAIQNDIAAKTAVVSSQSVTTTSQNIPKTPLPQCNGGPITEPAQAKYPVVDSSDEVTFRDSYKSIFSTKPGSKFSLTARDWLGTTGNCFYQFTQTYYPAKSYNGFAWCALFVSYIYGVNGYPTSTDPAYLTPTVNGLVFANLNRLVPSSVVVARSYVPRAGDMVIYERNGDSFYDHVGIATSTVEDPTSKQRFVLTREGNVRLDPNNPAPYVYDGINIVGVRSHALNDATILGYIRAPGNELPAL